MSGTSCAKSVNKSELIVSDNPNIQKHYEKCLAEGCSHRLAEMLATGQTPGIMTDAVFLEGTGEQFAKTPDLGDHYKKIAESHGQNVKGKVYKAGLARFPGDPLAWVSGRGDVQKVCEARGMDCDGAVRVRANERKPVEGVDIADDIVDDRVSRMVAASPGPLKESRQELREKVREQAKPKWKKRE